MNWEGGWYTYLWRLGSDVMDPEKGRMGVEWWQGMVVVLIAGTIVSAVAARIMGVDFLDRCVVLGVGMFISAFPAVLWPIIAIMANILIPAGAAFLLLAGIISAPDIPVRRIIAAIPRRRPRQADLARIAELERELGIQGDL